LAIWQKDNAQVAIVHLLHLSPTSNTPISLHGFADWRGNGALDPLVSINARSGRRRMAAK
jgi:hypothetical protein